MEARRRATRSLVIGALVGAAIPDPDQAASDERPYRLRGAAFSEAISFTVEKAR
jgi:hypothetical protein